MDEVTKKMAVNNYPQIVEALTCPVNRDMTRVEHSCDDRELFHHPEWLIAHYITNGGAIAFAKRREEANNNPEPEYII